MKQAATHWPIFVILVCVFLVCACAHVLARARMSDGGALASDSARVDLDAELDALCAHAWQQLKNLFHRYEGSQRLEDGLQAVEPGNILRYKISPLAQEECEEDDGGLLSRTASHLLSRTASGDMPQYLNGSPRASASTPEGANRSISPTPSFSGLRRTPSSQQLKALQHFAEGGGGTPKQTAEAMEAERLQELENKWQAAGVGDDPVGIREFLTYCLHRNVFELFFSLISSTIAKCSFLSERQAHERHTKQLLHHVHDSEVLVSTSQQKFQHSAQDAVMNMIRQYLAGPGEVPSDARADVKRKLQELMDRVVKTYAAFLTKHPAATYWEMQVPPAGDIVRFKKILDPRIARDEMNNKYEHLREECMNVMGKEFLVLAVSERLAVVQVLDSMGIAGQLILKPTYCPSPVQSAPCLVVAAPGSGRSTTIARALKEAKRLPPSAISEEGDAQELVFDGIVAGAAFLRYVGVSSCSNDGQSLLRSLVLEMRSVLQPDSCLAHPIPSSNAELVQEFVHCLRLASVECPIIVMIDGIEKLPQGDPIRELLWMPLEMPLHSRLIVGVSPAFCSHRILSLFRPVNVLHLEECSNYEMQSYIQGCHSNLPEAHKKAVSDFVAGMSIKSLTLTSLLCQHLLHVALGMPNEGVGPLPLRIALGAISLDEEALSAEAQQVLTMLAISRHGFSHAVLRQASALLSENAENAEDDDESGLRSSQPPWERNWMPWDVTFDMQLQHIRAFTRPTVHGRSMVLMLADPILHRAVRESRFFAASQEQVCRALISVLSNEGSLGIPKYQMLAELPHLQMHMACKTLQLPQHGPAALRETLCSADFLKLKIEAGLWEDSLKDFRCALRMFESTSFGANTSDKKLCQQAMVAVAASLTSISRVLVKPFHSSTICQLPFGDSTSGAQALSPPPPAQGGNSHEDAHGKFVQVDMDNETLISCTALVPIEETVSSCAVSSSTAPRVSLGLQDGHVVLWDAVLNEWSHRWKAHEHPVLSISFVHALDDSGSRDNGGRGGCVTWMLLTCSQREVAGWNLAVGHGSDRTGQLLFRCNIAADATPAPDMAELASFENAYYQGIQRCTRCNLLHRIPAPSAAAAPSTPRGPTNSRRVAPASGADTAPQLVDGADASILDATEDGCTPSASQDRITCLAASNVCGPGSKPHVPSAAAGAAETFSCLVAFGSEHGNMHVCTYTAGPRHNSAGHLVPHLSRHPVIKAHKARINHLAFRRAPVTHTDSAVYFASAGSDATIRVWRCELAPSSPCPHPPAECIYSLQETREVLWCALDVATKDVDVLQDRAVIYACGRGFMHEWSFESEGGLAWPACLQGAAKCKTTPGAQNSPTSADGGSMHSTSDSGGTDVRNLSIRKCCLMRSASPTAMQHGGGLAPVTATGAEMPETMPQPPVLLAFSQQIMVCWDVELDRAEQVQVSSKIVDADSSDDNTMAVSVSQEGLMQVWQRQPLARQACAPEHHPPNSQPGREELKKSVPLEQAGVKPAFASGLLIARCSHKAPVTSVSINSDGGRVVSVGHGEARFWETVPSSSRTSIVARIGMYQKAGAGESDTAPKILSGAAFFFSSEFGEVKQAIYFPALPPQHSLKEIEQHVVLVVWSSYQVHLFNVSDLTSPLAKVGDMRSDVRSCKTMSHCSVAVGGGDGALRVWSINLAKLPAAVKAPDRAAGADSGAHEESLASKLFRAADEDGNGTLDSDELFTVVRDLAANAGNHLSATQVSNEVQACMREYAGPDGVTVESFEQYTASCKLFSMQMSKTNAALLQAGVWSLLPPLRCL